MKKTFALGGFALAVLGSAALAAGPPASAWTIGPIIRGKAYSVNMPLRPTPTASGWSFEFPYASRDAGHVHYVTFDPGSLEGKSRIVVRYRIVAARGTRFVPQEQPDLPGVVSLFLQRRGDNWSARGRYEHYRWYAPSQTVQPLAPGEHQMTVRLDDPSWISVYGKASETNLQAFDDALADAGQIGLVFGSTAARGHGIFATAPARFELLGFSVQ
jgi:hypothetical protein